MDVRTTIAGTSTAHSSPASEVHHDDAKPQEWVWCACGMLSPCLSASSEGALYCPSCGSPEVRVVVGMMSTCLRCQVQWEASAGRVCWFCGSDDFFCGPDLTGPGPQQGLLDDGR